MKKGFILFVVMLMVSFISGCDQIKKIFESKIKPVVTAPPAPSIPSATPVEEQPKGTLLAKVNNKIITLEEFQQNIKNIRALAPDYKIDTFETKKNLLDEMINQELLYQEAKSRSVQNRKEVRELVDSFLRRAAVEQLIIDTTENVTVDAKEIETFYNQYKDQISEPEQRRTREIVSSSEDKAREILIALLQGQDFTTLAKEKSIAESNKNAGEIGFIQKGKRGEDYKKYDEIAFSLDVGQISSIFKGPSGYYVIKVEEIKAPKAKLLTDVWDEVKNTLLSLKQQQRILDLTDKLRGNATVEISEELLK